MTMVPPWPTARSASCGCARPRRCRATGGTLRGPPRRSRPTAGCAPATWPASTSGAWCDWPAGPRRCSSAAATTSTRQRSRRCWCRHPAVADVAVVPRPDPVMGEIGVAVVVPADSAAPPSLEEVRTFLRERIAAYKLPEALRLVDELPLTPMQKLDRRTLTAARRGRPPARRARRPNRSGVPGQPRRCSETPVPPRQPAGTRVWRRQNATVPISRTSSTRSPGTRRHPSEPSTRARAARTARRPDRPGGR